ncbi:hypothetical protein QBC42DRAFT_181088 [Cladorrhinum samala]|uniref:Uncharacterized protein n=1 Tax=Cladorrhinum samala TaxID=585594 RepID=A0AAV9HJR1_9PEZI|nr:hypothetical protein QBC42DRAFT_181088 [Cladorrhinum samala]
MALRYNAVNQTDDDKLASPLSPTADSISTSASRPSPASSPCAMADSRRGDQAFTPLSMNDSDYISDGTSAVEDDGAPKQADGTTYLSIGEGIVRSNSVSSTASATLANRSPQPHTIVGSMVQSFEALHALRATAAAKEQQDLLAKKSHSSLRGAALASPPATLSPSPSADPAVQQDASSNTSSVPAEPGADPEAAPQTAVLERPRTRPSTPLVPPPSIADTPLIRPTPTAAVPSPTEQEKPALVRTSSTASISLSHPSPDVNRQSKSGAFLGNIAALEATAERMSMTSSIEDAIRAEHNELKRSESQRSSILQRARAASGSDAGSAQPPSVASRQNSILETNNAARFGGYSPGGYIMSPHASMSAAGSGRLRSGSRASSNGAPATFGEPLEAAKYSASAESGEDFPFLSRNGPGKASVRSIASGKLSLAQIAELEDPTSLTNALDEADRGARRDGDPDDEDARIMASAHQHIDPEFADELDSALTPHAEALQPMLDRGFPAEPATRLQLHQPDQYSQYWAQHIEEPPQRPHTSTESVTTFDQAQMAFGDFDGVHCDPEAASAFVPHEEPEISEPQQQKPQPQPQPQPQPRSGARPKSYFDPMSGQEMLFYPAPVPAMLNLPPKLSKKTKEDAARNARRSQVLSAMPQASRESRVWLPDPLEGLAGNRDSLPPMTPADVAGARMSTATLTPQAPFPDSAHARHPSEASTIQQAPLGDEHLQPREIRRPQQLKNAENRKSRATILDGLPPQLRASAFFDLPKQLPKIEVKGGSAMDTLDSILDASTAAPVSAFTDHAFAGKLGSEVYGVQAATTTATKKKKKKAKHAAPAAEEEEEEDEEEVIPAKPKRKKLVKRNSSSNLLDTGAEAPKRSGGFSLFGGGKRASAEDSGDDDEEEFPRNGKAGPKPPRHPLAPGEDELSSEEESEEEDAGQDLYQGPPTTLLAELQIRKQQNKLRTRPAANAFPNGMHSTLLQLDAVAQVEAKARKGKRVNLAWEDPNANPDLEDDDDEDVPLGMLAVAKAVGGGGGGNANNRSTMDISALMSEVHRPLGLMERREMEDNEPLSRRRERLQGGEGPALPMSLDVMQKRMSHMPLTPSGNGLMSAMRSQSRLALPLPHAGGSRAGSVVSAEDETEVEGETLAARKARLAAENPLPRARPVSGMFSSELLSQFGGDDENDATSKGNGAHSRNASADTGKPNVPEEEETLGQRRRRLQAEREAREREMGAAGGVAPVRAMTPLGLNPAPGALPSRPISMADVLGAHPLDGPLGHVNPIERERLRKEAEAIRVQQQHELKMAALRAQMPQTMTTTSHGARTGGYMDGRFNNGLGGHAIASGMGLGYNGSNISLLAAQQQQPQQQQQRPITMAGYSAGGYPEAGYPGFGMQPTPGQTDMVERWRQSVLN